MGRPKFLGKSPLSSLQSYILTLLVVLSLAGCSLLERRNKNSEQDSSKEKTPSFVSYEKHKLLKQRYDELAKRYSLLQQELDPAENSRPEILEDLNASSDGRGNREGEDLAETVDVFADQQRQREEKNRPQAPERSSRPSSPKISSENVDSDLIEEHIQILRKVEDRVGQNRFNEALNEIKKIEDSPVRQIRVRAKFNLGEVLFSQEEYDLAMQVYEEIIKEDAFSGVVIKTLGRLIVCSENLKLDKKRDTYYSILHDFFERG